MFDTKTFALTLLPLLIASLIVLLVNSRIHHRMPGPGHWAAGAAIRFIGVILIAIGGNAPDFISVILIDVLVISGDVVILYGLCMFAGRPMFRWGPLIAALSMFVITSYYSSLVLPPVYRVIVLFSAHLFITLLSLKVQWRIAKRDGISGVLILAIASGLDIFLAPSQMLLLYLSPIYEGAAELLNWVQPMNAALIGILQTFGYTLLAANRTQKELHQMALLDILTGVPNRRAFDSTMKRAIEASRRHGTRLGLAVIDVYFFKRINDNHGHNVGDAVLRQLAATVAATLRDSDFFARIGGEEFALVVEDANEESMKDVTERFRHAVESAVMDCEGVTLKCTISTGVAISAAGQADFNALYTAADTALYRAKHGGRNRVEMAAQS